MVLYEWAPDTASGSAMGRLPPFPSSPLALFPQQNAVPAPLRAHVWELVAPAVSVTTPVRPITGAGDSTRSTTCPSSPNRLLPQQYTASLVVRPQVCDAPAAMALNLIPPETAFGPNCCGLAPAPSSPSWFPPQQNASPPLVMAQAWLLPGHTRANGGDPTIYVDVMHPPPLKSPDSPALFRPGHNAASANRS